MINLTDKQSRLPYWRFGLELLLELATCITCVYISDIIMLRLSAVLFGQEMVFL